MPGSEPVTAAAVNDSLFRDALAKRRKEIVRNVKFLEALSGEVKRANEVRDRRARRPYP